MLVRKPLDSDVFGFLNERPIAVAVRIAFRGQPQRIMVQRFHVKRGVKPDGLEKTT
jgi:hypothetical protein